MSWSLNVISRCVSAVPTKSVNPEYFAFSPLLVNAVAFVTLTDAFERNGASGLRDRLKTLLFGVPDPRTLLASRPGLIPPTVVCWVPVWVAELLS